MTIRELRITLNRTGASLPQLGHKKPSQKLLTVEAGEPGTRERRSMVGQASGLQPGENAEAKIEAVDKQPRGDAERTLRNLEVGDDPYRARGKLGCNVLDQLVQLRLAEAVEKEMSDNEVVGLAFRGLEAKGVDLADPEPIAPMGAALTQKVEHSCAAVDRCSSEAWIGF